MAESFLSCDNMKVHPTKDSKKEPPQMIVLSTSALATDDSKLRCRRSKPPMPKMCFLIPIRAAAIFGVASTSLLSVAIYVYCLVHMLHTNPDPDAPQKIAILSVALVIILLFSILFVWGLFANRHRLLLAFTTLSCFLLFAVVGALVATLVTTVDELNSALSKAEVGTNGKQNLADLVIFRVVLGVTALVLAIEVYVYIRMFLYIRAVRRVMSR